MQSKTRAGAPHIRYNTNNGPDGGSGGGGGYGGGTGGGGGGGGVRTAHAPPQQDKASPPSIALHHPANHMMSAAYHAGRPPAQPPPSQGTLPPGYLHYTTNPALARPPPRHQISAPRPPTATLIPFYADGTVNTLCAPFYQSMPMVPVYGGSSASEGGRAPPPGTFPWPTNPSQAPVTIMTAQPPAAQPNPQQQPQPQPSPYPQSQYAYLSSRVSHPYTTGAGGAAGTTVGVQQAPPTTVLVERPLQPPPVQLQAKTKTMRKNRIPIINPDTGMEVNVEESGGAGGGTGGSGHQIQDHSGNTGHPHSHLHHSTNNQVSSGDSARIAADFAKQVAQAAMNEPPSRVSREPEEPQVNGPCSEVLVQPAVEESAPPPAVTTPVQATKRPPGPTPVVSAQAEGTTYDIQSIRNSSRVEIRSSESSPARNKLQSQQQNIPSLLASTNAVPVQVGVPVAVPQVHSIVQPPPSNIHHHEPPPSHSHVVIPSLLQHHQVGGQPHQPSEVLIQSPVVHHSMPPPQIVPQQVVQQQVVQPQQVVQQPPVQPQPVPQQPIAQQQIPQQQVPVEMPKPMRQRPARVEEKKPVTVVKPPPPQIEEKEEATRIKTSLSGARQAPSVSKDEELVSHSNSNISIAKSIVKIPILPAFTDKPLQTVSQAEIKTQPSEKQQINEKHQQNEKHKEKSVERSVEKPVEVERPVPEPSEKTDKPVIVKAIEKQSSPAPVPAPVAPPKAKTAFAEGFSLHHMKITAKAAQSAVQLQAAQTATAQLENADSTESHTQVKSLKNKKGKNKMREMNQKGVEKEGTDMDAFVDTRTSDNNNRANDISSRITAPSDNKTTESRTNIDNSRTNSNSTDIINTDRPTDRSRTDNSSTDNSKLTTDIISSKNDREKSPAAQADATNNNINNQIAQQLEEEEVDDDMVAAKNEENMKKNIVEDEDLEEEDAASQDIAPPSQPVLKYQYKDDQWSPVNPDGKKVYERDFLIKLRDDPLSAKKPDIITDVEIFVKEGQMGIGGLGGGAGMRRGMSSHSQHGGYSVFGSSGSMRGASNNGLFPDFYPRSLSQRMPPKRNSSQGGGGNRGMGGGGGNRSLKQYNSLRGDDYKHNENAWKPTKLTRGMDSKTKDERDTEDLYKKVRGILNKLTPQKFDTLLLQFQNLPISSLERLQGTIRLVFEKAVDEPAFSVSYALLCKYLAKLQVDQQNASAQQAAAAAAANQQNQENTQPKPQQPVHFRKLLITRCQQEFETNKKLELDFEKRQQDINAISDTEKRKEAQLLFNEEERKIRMKSVGLVTFIGELFKLKMLTANIMHGCIKQLLGKIDEESLECLCKLLTTIGKEFEEQIQQTSSKTSQGGGIGEFNEYFAQMTKLSRKHEGSKVSSRVRFMLQDVIELRQNNWVPRRDENKPKTMAQIQAEVERESEKAALLAAQPLRLSQNMNQDRNQRRNNQRGGNVQNEEGWTNVTSTKYRSSSYAAELSKMQGLKSTAGQELLDRGSRSETVTLGPSSAFRWGAAGSGNNRMQTASANFTDNNSFSLLDGEKKLPTHRMTPLKTQLSEDKDNKQADKEKLLQSIGSFMGNSTNNKDSRDSSRGRVGHSGGSPSPSLSGPPSMRKAPLVEGLSRAADQKRTQGESGRPSAESSRESTPALSTAPATDMRTEPAQKIEPKKVVDEEKLKQYATILIKEYLVNQNIQESIESYKEMFMEDSSLFISTCLNFLLEQMKRENRMKTSQLLGKLLGHQLYQTSSFVSEVELIFEVINDFAVDIPHIWQYIGEIFGDLMAVECLDFSHLKQASKAIPSGDDNKLDQTLKQVFKILLLEKGPVWIKKLWDSSNVELNDFISDKQVADKFLIEHAFLEGKEVAVSDSNIPYDKVQEKLLAFLKDNKENFDQICGWLTSNVGKRTNDPKFIRELTEAVIKASLVSEGSDVDKSSSYQIDNKLLKKNLYLIKRYVDNKEELELWCLYSVQHLVVNSMESPQGMLLEIFRELYESMAISPDGFNKWKLEEDCCETWQKEGRGVALTSLKSFFQLLDCEQDDEQDEETS